MYLCRIFVKKIMVCAYILRNMFMVAAATSVGSICTRISRKIQEDARPVWNGSIEDFPLPALSTAINPIAGGDLTNCCRSSVQARVNGVLVEQQQ